MIAVNRTLAVTAAIALSLGAQAVQAASGNEGSRAIELSGPVVMLGTTVPPGSYTLHWSRDHGSDGVKVEIMQGRNVLAEGKGAWIAIETPSPYDALVYRPDNGASALSEIRFRGSADSIQIAPGAARAEARQEKSTSGTTLNR